MQRFDHLATDELMVIALENRNRIDALRRRRGVECLGDALLRRAMDLQGEVLMIRSEVMDRTGRVPRWIL